MFIVSSDTGSAFVSFVSISRLSNFSIIIEDTCVLLPVIVVSLFAIVPLSEAVGDDGAD